MLLKKKNKKKQKKQNKLNGYVSTHTSCLRHVVMLDTKFLFLYDNHLALFIVYVKWTECILWLQGMRITIHQLYK